MEALFGLLVMLLGLFNGVETLCDGRQNGSQCYGALGGTVVLRLMDRASKKYIWLKNSKEILSVHNHTILTNVIENRSLFTASNGTFRIDSLNRSDGGEYILDIFELDGKKLERRTLQLNIQAPVSSVLLVSTCLSEGQMRVICSSEGGDSPQYSWTLGGRSLTDAQLLSGNTESNNITLKQDVSGQLVCSVWNHVSKRKEEKTISTCGFTFIQCTLSNGTYISQWVPEENNTLCIASTAASTEEYLKLMAGVLSALVILLVIGLAVVYAHKKKQNKPKATEVDDGQELTYADVRIVKQQGRQTQRRAETEVEYGQVKFSERPQQTAEPAGGDCVYAMVRKSR